MRRPHHPTDMLPVAAHRGAAAGWATAVAAAALLSTGCYAGLGPGASEDGGDDDPGAATVDGGDGDGDGDGADAGDDGPGEPPPQSEIGPEPMQRLSDDEYRHTIRDLLGDVLFEGVQLELAAVPVDARVHLGLGPADSGHLDAYAAVAAKAAQLLVDDKARFADIGAACLTDEGATTDCVREAIIDFGLRAYRRPLTDEEFDDLVAFYAEPDDHDEGLIRVVMRLLMSPQLLFHVEVAGELVDDVLALDDYAVASRLSYRVLGTMPTPALFEAAAAGQLRTVDDLEAQVAALLLLPAAEEHAARLFEAWMEIEAFPVVPAAEPLLQGLDPTELRTSAMREFSTFVHTLVWEDDATFAELMTSTKAFPDSVALAEIYGVDVWAEGQPAQPSAQVGLLQRAASMSLGTHNTAPILRGVFLLRNVLCDATPSPDAAIVNSRFEDLDGLDPAELTARQVVETITADAECQACHGIINPLSFAMENLDPLGRKRTHEVVYDAQGNVLAEHPVDASVELTLPGRETTTITGSDALVDALSTLPAAQRCFAQRIYEYTRHRPADAQDAVAVQRLEDVVGEQGASVVEVLAAHAASESTLWRELGE